MAYNVILNVAAEVARKRAENGVPVSPDDTVCVIRTNTGNIYTGISRIEIISGVTNIIHAEVDAISQMKAKEDCIIDAIAVLNSYNLAPILPCNNCIKFILSLNPENARCVIITPNTNIPITEVNMFIANSQPRAQNPNPNMNPNMNSGYTQNNYYGYTPDMQNMNAPNMNNVPPQSGGYMQGYQQYSNQMYQHQMSGMPANQSQQFSNSMNSVSQNLVSPVSVQLNSAGQNPNNHAYINSMQTSSMLPPDTTKASKGDMLKNKISDLLNDDVSDDEEDGAEKKKKSKKKFGGLFK